MNKIKVPSEKKFSKFTRSPQQSRFTKTPFNYHQRKNLATTRIGGGLKKKTTGYQPVLSSKAPTTEIMQQAINVHNSLKERSVEELRASANSSRISNSKKSYAVKRSQISLHSKQRQVSNQGKARLESQYAESPKVGKAQYSTANNTRQENRVSKSRTTKTLETNKSLKRLPNYATSDFREDRIKRKSQSNLKSRIDDKSGQNRPTHKFQDYSNSSSHSKQKLRAAQIGNPPEYEPAQTISSAGKRRTKLASQSLDGPLQQQFNKQQQHHEASPQASMNYYQKVKRLKYYPNSPQMQQRDSNPTSIKSSYRSNKYRNRDDSDSESGHYSRLHQSPDEYIDDSEENDSDYRPYQRQYEGQSYESSPEYAKNLTFGDSYPVRLSESFVLISRYLSCNSYAATSSSYLFLRLKWHNPAHRNMRPIIAKIPPTQLPLLEQVGLMVQSDLIHWLSQLAMRVITNSSNISDVLLRSAWVQYLIHLSNGAESVSISLELYFKFKCVQVNLEDLVNEEEVIYKVYDSVSHYKKCTNLCVKWWRTTEQSSVKEMESFFEEESSKKLIRQQQIILILVMSYIETSECNFLREPQSRSSIKNILENAHKNYLIFVDFICRNLTADQKRQTFSWAEALMTVLKTRSTRKTFYKSDNNSETLRKNNEISLQLLKKLCRSKRNECNDFKKIALELIQRIDAKSVSEVRVIVNVLLNEFKTKKQQAAARKKRGQLNMRQSKVYYTDYTSTHKAVGDRGGSPMFDPPDEFDDMDAHEGAHTSKHNFNQSESLRYEVKPMASPSYKDTGIKAKLTQKNWQKQQNYESNAVKQKQGPFEICNKQKERKFIPDYQDSQHISRKGEYSNQYSPNQSTLGPNHQGQYIQSSASASKRQTKCLPQKTLESDDEDDLSLAPEEPLNEIPVPHKMGNAEIELLQQSKKRVSQNFKHEQRAKSRLEAKSREQPQVDHHLPQEVSPIEPVDAVDIPDEEPDMSELKQDNINSVLQSRKQSMQKQSEYPSSDLQRSQPLSKLTQIVGTQPSLVSDQYQKEQRAALQIDNTPDLEVEDFSEQAEEAYDPEKRPNIKIPSDELTPKPGHTESPTSHLQKSNIHEQKHSEEDLFYQDEAESQNIHSQSVINAHNSKKGDHLDIFDVVKSKPQSTSQVELKEEVLVKEKEIVFEEIDEPEVTLNEQDDELEFLEEKDEMKSSMVEIDQDDVQLETEEAHCDVAVELGDIEPQSPSEPIEMMIILDREAPAKTLGEVKLVDDFTSEAMEPVIISDEYVEEMHALINPSHPQLHKIPTELLVPMVLTQESAEEPSDDRSDNTDDYKSLPASDTNESDKIENEMNQYKNALGNEASETGFGDVSEMFNGKVVSTKSVGSDHRSQVQEVEIENIQLETEETIEIQNQEKTSPKEELSDSTFGPHLNLEREITEEYEKIERESEPGIPVLNQMQSEPISTQSGTPFESVMNKGISKDSSPMGTPSDATPFSLIRQSQLDEEIPEEADGYSSPENIQKSYSALVPKKVNLEGDNSPSGSGVSGCSGGSGGSPISQEEEHYKQEEDMFAHLLPKSKVVPKPEQTLTEPRLTEMKHEQSIRNASNTRKFDSSQLTSHKRDTTTSQFDSQKPKQRRGRQNRNQSQNKETDSSIIDTSSQALTDSVAEIPVKQGYLDPRELPVQTSINIQNEKRKENVMESPNLVVCMKKDMVLDLPEEVEDPDLTDEIMVDKDGMIMDMNDDEADELARIDAELNRFCMPEKAKPIPPFLPKVQEHEYTLVLDLDETLIHYEEDFYLVRPYVEEFLSELSHYYELVLFTASVQDYADWIMDQVDLKKYVKHRLYREHTVYQDEMYIKDLSLLGRDLKKTIIIDNLYESFINQPHNGILCKSWYDDMEDNELQILLPFLKEIVENKADDVTEELKKVLMCDDDEGEEEEDETTQE